MGTLLGRYEVLLGIAQGGMARVWAARLHGQRGFRKIVALKTILPTLATNQDFETMFLDEARVASGIQHPNVCEIFDLGEQGGILYLAMEWVNGESLARVVRPPVKEGKAERKPIEARIAARIIADSAAGLHAAHELSDELGTRLGVVHRDVSPQNILLSVSGNVKVTDFGVVQALSNAESTTRSGEIKGKAAYMSPEQASGRRVDRRSDVYALGICLYEITTGKRPFSAGNPAATLELSKQGDFDKPRDLIPGYPRKLESIVLRAMAKEPAQRYPTAERFRLALEEWLARSGPVVTERQVAELVEQRVGKLVSSRTSKLRKRLLTTSGPYSVPPSEGTPSSTRIPSGQGEEEDVSNSQPSGSEKRERPPNSTTPTALPAKGNGRTEAAAAASRPQKLGPRGNSRTRTAALGVGLGAVVFAVLGFSYRKCNTKDPTEASTSTTPTAATSTDTTKANSTHIRLQLLVPKQGVSLELDGKKLPAGKLTITRPPTEKIAQLSVSAEGYQTEVFRLDAETPEILDVMLAKQPSDANADGKASQENAPKKEAPKGPGLEPDIPKNPF